MARVPVSAAVCLRNLRRLEIIRRAPKRVRVKRMCPSG
jgi:hypothetical protein